MYKVYLKKKILHPEGFVTLRKMVTLPFPPILPITLIDENGDDVNFEGRRTVYYDIPEKAFQVELEEIVCRSKKDFEFALA